jgi:hypothetical protein
MFQLTSYQEIVLFGTMDLLVTHGDQFLELAVHIGLLTSWASEGVQHVMKDIPLELVMLFMDEQKLR